MSSKHSVLGMTWGRLHSLANFSDDFFGALIIMGTAGNRRLNEMKLHFMHFLNHQPNRPGTILVKIIVKIIKY
jgi:hypothetical protein